MKPEAFYLAAPTGQRFCVFHAPRRDAARAAIVYLHPFAEEMNKSRRMAAMQARAFAAAGCAVLQIDLLGCGDSSGDFGDADWAAWLADAAQAAAWLRARCPAPLWFWGLRLGGLLAAEAAARAPEPARLLLWQPVISGKQFLNQFLRLKVAGDMLAGDAKGTMTALRQELAAGTAVEIAGYRIAAALAQGIEAAELTPPATVERVVWFEVDSRADATLSPAAQVRLEAWRQRCAEVDARVVAGPPFWQTTEIEVAPALIEASLGTVAAMTPA